MHDALVAVTQGMDGHTELGDIAAERLDLSAADRVGDRPIYVDGGSVVILGCQRKIVTPELTIGDPEALEGLRAGDLMAQMQVDVEQVGFSGARTHHMVVPELLAQRFSHIAILTLLFK